MLRPLPDLNDAETLAKLGREYTLMNARRDALHQLRDAVSTLQSPHDSMHAEALANAREAIERLEQLQLA
jgi:hypothetical protein